MRINKRSLAFIFYNVSPGRRMDGRISDLLMVEWMQRQVDRRMDGLMNGRKGRLTKEQSVRLTTIVN